MTFREFLGWPALFAVLATLAALLVLEVLHLAGVRWRPGWLEAIGATAAVTALVLSVARFYVYT